MTHKVYEKFGKQFRITTFPKPSEDEIVYFTSNEWSWLQDQETLWNPCQREEYFIFMWFAKKNDFNYQIIPDAPDVNSMANLYAEQIKEILRGKN